VCQMTECCGHHWIRPNISLLEQSLGENLFGQQSCQGSCQEEGPQEGASDELPRVDGVGQELRGQVHCGEPV